jgi:hypothetical protein
MYSLCNKAFALIYGLLNLGGTSQPESSPVLLKELYSYPLETNAKSRIISIEFSEDAHLSATSESRSYHPDVVIINTRTSLESNSHNTSLVNETMFYEADQHEVRFYKDGKTFSWDTRNFSLRMPTHILMNRDKNILALGGKKSFIVADIADKEKLFEYKMRQRTLNALSFINKEEVICVFSYCPLDDPCEKYPGTIIQMLNVKTKEDARFITLSTCYCFNAIAATDDVVMASDGIGVILWDRCTKSFLSEISSLHNCTSIALHPKNNTCAILSYKHYTSWKTEYEPHITTYLLPRKSLFKKETMLAMLQRKKYDTRFHFS